MGAGLVFTCLDARKMIAKLEFEYHDFMSVYCSPWVFNKILQKP